MLNCIFVIIYKDKKLNFCKRNTTDFREECFLVVCSSNGFSLCFTKTTGLLLFLFSFLDQLLFPCVNHAQQICVLESPQGWGRGSTGAMPAAERVCLYCTMCLSDVVIPESAETYVKLTQQTLRSSTGRHWQTAPPQHATSVRGQNEQLHSEQIAHL